jgi:hypothetical protein
MELMYSASDQQDPSQGCAGKLVVARCDCTILLQRAEKALNEIAFAIEGEVGLARLLSVGPGRDHRRDVAPFERLDQCVGIVPLVGNKGIGIDTREQRFGLRSLGGLT